MLMRFGGKWDDAAVGLWNHLYSSFKPTVVLDVGANYGEVIFSRRYPPGTVLHVIEANPVLASCLERTITDFGGDVHLHRWGASDGESVGTFRVSSEQSGLGSLVHNVPGHDISVQLRRIDSIPLPPLARLLFKIDVEGYEIKVLDGLSGWLDACIDWIGFIEAEHLTPDAARSLLLSFTIHLVEKDTWRLTRVSDPQQLCKLRLPYMRDILVGPLLNRQPR
jgi:FkbM family methyltransferase